MEQHPKKLLPDDFIRDQVRETIRRKHYSFRTEKSYVAWIRRYIFFHNKRHQLEIGCSERDVLTQATISRISLISFLTQINIGVSRRVYFLPSCSFIFITTSIKSSVLSFKSDNKLLVVKPE